MVPSLQPPCPYHHYSLVATNTNLTTLRHFNCSCQCCRLCFLDRRQSAFIVFSYGKPEILRKFEKICKHDNITKEKNSLKRTKKNLSFSYKILTKQQRRKGAASAWPRVTPDDGREKSCRNRNNLRRRICCFYLGRLSVVGDTTLKCLFVDCR